jgi:hypothetical protein
MNSPRKYLSTTGLLEITSNVFKKIKSQIKGTRKNPITLHDCLMSAVAMFGLKYPALLQFNDDCKGDSALPENLKNLYKVKNVPSDTYMRERLDESDPNVIRKSFSKIFAAVQRGKVLEQYKFLGNSYLVSVDGSGFFSSEKVFCENCCVKNHKNGSKSYYHQMYCGAIVHPNMSEVIPFAPEAIMKHDGIEKNDCEFNAVKRFVNYFAKEHPFLKIIITGDGLLSKSTTINLFKSHRMSFILGAKPKDHKYLFEFVEPICETETHETKDKKLQKFRYYNAVPLNESNSDLLVNFLELTETDLRTGKSITFSWVTDIHLTKKSIHLVAQGGRARWKIENETFNTLKNQGYHFEHNFGHGNQNLSTIFGMLMMLAFLIDQVQAICDPLFQQALKKRGRKKYLWENIRSLFFNFIINSWETLWNSVIKNPKVILNST